MREEIRAIQATLLEVTQRVRDLRRGVDLRSAAVLYRGLGDEYITKHHPFTDDIEAFDRVLREVTVDGGGDQAGPRSPAADTRAASPPRECSWRVCAPGRMSNARSSSSAVPVLLGLVALAVSSVALFRQPGPDPAPADPGAALAELIRRVEALEARRPAAGLREPAAPRVERAPVQDPRVDDLLRRVERLEAERASAPQAGGAEGDPRRAAAELIGRLTAARERDPRAIESARTTILDPRASEADKIAAWSTLRQAGPDAWTDVVVDEMIRLGLGSADAQVRAAVWRQADADARSERLVPALLQALAQDSAANVREEAAETLENYLDSPGVRAALETAGSADADEGVRRQARRSLAKR